MAHTENNKHGQIMPRGRRDRKPVLLFIDYQVPQYDLFAGSRTNFMYLKMLVGMGLEVKFLPEDFYRIEPYSSVLNKLGIETLDGDWYRHNWETWLKENGQSIDYVFCHKPDPASTFLPAVLRYTKASVIYQCHDLHYLRLRRKAEIENDPAIFAEADSYEKKEDFIFSNSDVLLTFSEVEERFIQAKFPAKKVFTVPLFFYPDTPELQRDFSARKDLLYVGACAHAPNRDAVAWFCSEVFPLIQKKIPQIALNVVGANPPPDIAALQSDSIRILGRVSDQELDELYAGVRMMVVPLRFGAGVKGKVIESLYNGTPIVSTSIGLEGIKDIGQLMSAKDSPEGFAAEVVSLYLDENKLLDLSQRGSKMVADNFTLDKTAELMATILSESRRQAASRIEATAPVILPQSPPRLIAFYLPQFHRIPENDEWWGEGFTEWRNVASAEPLFPGHYQPHVPAELGYYDLKDQATQLAQAELAKSHGIEGFCYYHYWFNGKRLLQEPLDAMLQSGQPDYPFCLCWANENWTRRWDGEDRQVLIRQDYSEEDDRQHIRTLLPMFADPRYIRINGKPIFLVYRSENLPDPARTAEVWREEARNAGLGELYLCRVESIGSCDPRETGFDAAVEFAPDWSKTGAELEPGSELLAGREEDMKDVCAHHHVRSYKAMANSMMARENPGFKWFRCVMPAWDNSARRRKAANIFLDSTPEAYEDWLAHSIADTNSRLHGQERVVFINAWNEWAEGCHLEPDQEFGHAYLDATRQALLQGLHKESKGNSDDVRVAQLMSELEEIRYQLNAVDLRLDESKREIDEILRSTSWKLSAPVRRVKQAMLDLKNRLSG